MFNIEYIRLVSVS